MGKRIITALFVLLPIALFAQSKTARVDHIKKVVTDINTDKTLTKVVLDNEYLADLRPGGEMPDNGQEITGYLDATRWLKL